MPAPASRREVSSSLVAEVTDPTRFVLAVAVAREVPTMVESLTVRLDEADVAVREVIDRHGTRLHVFDTVPGILHVEYAATVSGRAPEPEVDDLDLVTYLRPSRYVPSDALVDRARDIFPGLAGRELVGAIEGWVHARLRYLPEASTPTGGALETLDAGAGVCRDFAHLTTAFLRALDVPARLVSVYAPQLEPPDFHAVVEAYIEGRWVVLDATRLAPRRGLVRIATGRDAADTAFLTNTLADVELRSLEVRAAGEAIAPDDPAEQIVLT